MDLRYAVLESTKENLIHRICSHSFLDRCRKGTISLDELKEFLVQQGLYSSYFTRYLCALMANLTNNDEVMELAENLFEELGLDGKDATPHYLIYRRMLKQFGLTLEGAKPTPETKKLIDTMLSHCKNANPAYGLGALCLGAEALVPPLYSDIIAGFTACGVDSKDLEFFRIHVECDDGHAETIRDIMLNIAANDTEQIQIMLQSGLALVNARLDFFSGVEVNNELVVAQRRLA